VAPLRSWWLRRYSLEEIRELAAGLSSITRANSRIVASLANVIRFTFFSGSGVKTAADLKGGVVGISSFGSETDSTATFALKRLGLSRGDVTLKEYGGGTARLAAVKSGEIKATAVNEPFSSMAREQGFNVLFDLVPEQIPWLFTAIVVRRGDIAGLHPGNSSAELMGVSRVERLFGDHDGKDLNADSPRIIARCRVA